MHTTPFGSPAAPAPVPAAPPTPPGAAGRPWTRSPLVLGCAGLGVLALAAAAVVLTSGEDPAATAAPPVPVATATPTTATPTTAPGGTVVPAVAAGRNPFFALVTGGAAGAAGGAAPAAPTGAAAPALGRAAPVRVVPGPTVVQRVEVPVPVPGPTVTQQVPAPAAPADPELITYLGPDSDVPDGARFRLSGGEDQEERSLRPGEAFATTGPLAWLVLTRIGDDGHAVVTGGAMTYDLAPGVTTTLF